MSIALVAGLSATSETSFEGAINEAVARATKTLRDVGQRCERKHRGWQHQGLQGQPGGNFPAGGSLLERISNRMPVA
jgi:hypothetical protein